MRDQYAGDLSDLLKFAFLRAVTGSEKSLGVAWYYISENDGRADGRLREWRGQVQWRDLDSMTFNGLAELSEPSVAGLEQLPIWPESVVFHREVVPRRPHRERWFEQMRTTMGDADIVFLDPDNGLGERGRKHVSTVEIESLRRSGRTIVLITFPGRHLPHDQLVERLHQVLKGKSGANSVVTLRTSISVPNGGTSRSMVQRQRWFTVIDPDPALTERVHAFRAAPSRIPNTSVRCDGDG